MSNYNFRLICKKCYRDLQLHDIHNSIEEVMIFIHPCECVAQQSPVRVDSFTNDDGVKMDYSKLADEFIEDGVWQGLPVIAISMFAKWIEEHEANKHNSQ